MTAQRATRPYQLTPAASKGNAFCWLSWQAEMRWTWRETDTQSTRKDDALPVAKPQTKVELILKDGPKTAIELMEAIGMTDRTQLFSIVVRDIKAGRIVCLHGKYMLTEKAAA